MVVSGQSAFRMIDANADMAPRRLSTDNRERTPPYHFLHEAG